MNKRTPPDGSPPSAESIAAMLAYYAYILQPSDPTMKPAAASSEYYDKIDQLVILMHHAGLREKSAIKSVETQFTPPIKKCARCGNRARRFCATCPQNQFLTGKSAQLKTYYCGKACQVAHRAKHKPLCDIVKRVKAVFQAGDLLQKFYRRWVKEVLVFTECMVGDVEALEKKVKAMGMDASVIKGLAGHVPDSDLDRAKAILFYGSEDLVNFMRDFGEKVLGSYCTRMLEVRIDVDENGPEHALYFDDEGEQPDLQDEHWVLKVSVQGEHERDQIDFAIDPNGKQYAQEEGVMLWSEYEKVMPGKIKSCDVFGTVRASCESAFEDSTLRFEEVDVEQFEECEEDCTACKSLEGHVEQMVEVVEVSDRAGGLEALGENMLREVKIAMAQELGRLNWRDDNKQSMGTLVASNGQKYIRAREEYLKHAQGVMDVVCNRVLEAHDL